MRYCYTAPPILNEYPWDPPASRAMATAEEWCTNNLPEKSWSIKRRVDKFGMLHVTFWFQRIEDLTMFKIVCI